MQAVQQVLSLSHVIATILTTATHLAAALDDEGEIDANRGGEWLHLVRVRARVRARARARARARVTGKVRVRVRLRVKVRVRCGFRARAGVGGVGLDHAQYVLSHCRDLGLG